MFIIYSIVIHLAFVLLLPVLLMHPKLRDGFLSRLGFFRKGWPGKQRQPVIWFHGASAGDLLALQPVIAEVHKRDPQAFLVVTTLTNSGMTMAKDPSTQVDAYGYLPYDLPWAVARAVRAIAPDVLVLEYAEVWPALVRSAKRRNSAVVIINGRFNERALGRYRWLYRVIGNPLRQVDLFCMREEVEREHALSIGAPAERIRVTGNTKFDSCHLPPKTDEKLQRLGRQLGVSGSSLVLLAGSTHEGEEGSLLRIFVELKKKFPSLRLILAPRYIERANRLMNLAREHGLSCVLRSQGAKDETVVILDSIGELKHVYGLSTIVVMGGSFIKRGGQNILEPASRGRPVLFGPHMENFQDSVRVLLGRGGIQVPDFSRLEEVLTELLSNPQEMKKLGQMASVAVTSVQGASVTNAEAILTLAQKGKKNASG